jgi:FkbM family methyltransferase
VRLTDWLKTALPHGLVTQLTRQRELRRWGIEPETVRRAGGTGPAHRAVRECNYLLWPEHLRRPPHKWALVDVGANRGQFLAAALRLVAPARVVAFEPLAELAAGLPAQLPPAGVLVRPVAVGARQGTVSLHQTDNSVFSSVLTPAATLGGQYGRQPVVCRTLEVPQVTLDAELEAEPRIGLLKLDVQGYEPQVLAGAGRTLQKTDAVLIEINYAPHYEGESPFEVLHEALTAAGFRLGGASCPNLGAGGAPLWADAIYTRR